MFATNEPAVWNTTEWPPEVCQIMSWLEGQKAEHELRQYRRSSYRVKAAIGLVATIFDESIIIPIYTRDAHPDAMGFIATRELPVGSLGRLHLPTASQAIWQIECTILRSAQFVDGWFDCAVKFMRPQKAFELEDIALI
jgi:hypothetical protein